MTIQEQIAIINQKFSDLHRAFMEIDREKKSLESQYQQKLSYTHQGTAEKRSDINNQREQVLKFYRIAQTSTDKQLVPQRQKMSPPDLYLLNDLIIRVDRTSRHDSVADRIVDLAGEYVAYLNEQERRLDKQDAASDRMSQNEYDANIGSLEQKKRQIIHECARYLEGEDVRRLAALFDRVNRDYEISENSFREFGKSKSLSNKMLTGYCQEYLDVPRPLIPVLKRSLGRHFDENSRMVNCPAGFVPGKLKELHVEYTQQNEQKLMRGISALVLNLLRYFPLGAFRVSLFDQIYFNTMFLGDLGILARGKKSIIDCVCSDDESRRKELQFLSSYYHEIEQKLGLETVYDYNKTHSEREQIPFRLLILNQMQDTYGHNLPELSYLRNNAQKFGITVLFMEKNPKDGSIGSRRELPSDGTGNVVHILSDSSGQFFIQKKKGWVRYEWICAPARIPIEFLEGLHNGFAPKQIGTEYFKRYAITLPARSVGTRKPIAVPFAIDSEDRVINCEFERDNFAAYLMGATGSGKSTLIHTIIGGLLMNYHPDELELWLLDFKMLEFRRYVKNCPPHVKYILLEKSEDLVFDLIDRLTGILDERQFVFSQNGWSKLSDVPVDVYMPAIFVIIDEFAQMSQILSQTKGLGYERDYTLKLENLLAKGRALGFKFIFSSQTYTTGVSGLTETASKQILMRFAMKNTLDEIKATLAVPGGQISPVLEQTIETLPTFETVYKWADRDNRTRLGHFRNLYIKNDEMEQLLEKIAQAIRPSEGDCRDKQPVCIDGQKPQTFRSQLPSYKRYEENQTDEELDENDVWMYPGVPCSFYLAKPFLLEENTAQNILLAGGSREEQASILLSLINSYHRTGNPIEVWSSRRAGLYKRYRKSFLQKFQTETELDVICGRIRKLKEKILTGGEESRLIIVFGYENLCNEMDLLSESAEYAPIPEPQPEEPAGDDLNSIVDKINACKDPKEKERLLREYNQSLNTQSTPSARKQSGTQVYRAQNDVDWLLRRAPKYGIHFLFCFDQANDFVPLKIDKNIFLHKLLFAMSRDDSYDFMGSKKASELDGGVCLYSDGKHFVHYRPHIYRGIPLGGWTVDENYEVIQR